MKSFIIYSLSVIILGFLSACSKDKIPGVYRIDIQQGNNVSQEMLNKLERGMNKNQVAYVMGTPLLIDTFHPNRWDYLYSFQPGNGKREQRRITLFFDEDEKLTHIEGDTAVVERDQLTQIPPKDTSVVVPLAEKKTGLFTGLLNMIGFDDEEEIIEDDTEAEKTSEGSTPSVENEATQ